MAEARLKQLLEDLDIRTNWHEHAAVFTVEESSFLHQRISGRHSKNLFLKDAAGQFWLVTVPANARVDLKALPASMGSRRLSFGGREDMLRLLAITPGSVTPLAAMNDAAGEVRIVLDSAMAADACVNVHPLRNTATISLAGKDLVRFLDHVGHSPTIIAVPALQHDA